jgi:predicted N-formylglutamate amidohydrolase
MPFQPFLVAHGRPSAPIVLTCDHASEHLPDPWRWPTEDHRLLGTHWASDPGAQQLTWELASLRGLPAVASTFSRLLIDPNRPLDSATLLRDVADGAPVMLNQRVSAADREERIERCYLPYHRALAQMVATHTPRLVFAMHTFTPQYEGTPREVAVGVLFDRDEDAGARLTHELRKTGLVTRENEPWSGKGGFMYAAQHHAEAHDALALELEVRQDLATDPRFRAWFTVRLAEALDACFPDPGPRR